MKVLHVTTSSKGGAGIAAIRLHEALHKYNVKSAFVSANLAIDYNNKIISNSFFAYKRPNYFKKILNKLKKYYKKSEKEYFEKELKLLTNKINCEIATLPFSNYQLQNHPLYLEADIINLHWIDGIVDYPTFFSKSNKPIIWTFHDMNPFMGIFHYHNDEVRNIEIASSLNFKIKEIKKNAITKVKNGVVVTPSNWLLEEAKKNQVFSNFDKFCVPNSIDLDVFKVNDKNKLRDKYNIDKNDFAILFVSDSLTNNRKGYDLLVEALMLLKNQEVTLLTIGKGSLPFIENHKVIYLGEIYSSSKMAECYSLADAFVLPSREDNLPNVMLESFACGLPLVGFKVGGISEHVIENHTGVLAKEISAQSLAEAIINMKNNYANYNTQIIRKYAEDSFNFQKQADSYLDLYDFILKQSGKV
ncbi:glycosyltransferase [Flavobacterium sp.]|uniref:glycosyltransferase n=1 Tax=Flavobacterium sp. TaxID=239 RepID=UPI0031DA68A3